MEIWETIYRKAHGSIVAVLQKIFLILFVEDEFYKRMKLLYLEHQFSVKWHCLKSCWRKKQWEKRRTMYYF